MRISEEFGIFWNELTGKQKLAIVALILFVMAAIGSGWISSFSAWRETRKFDRDAAVAKQEAINALKKAADLAHERTIEEKKVLELEAKRDAKITEVEQKAIDVVDARIEYDRGLRESRGDNPSAEQLCAELAAAGHPC